MGDLVRRVVFLFAYSIPMVCFAIPDNAHMVGDSWYCDQGYRRQGNECIKLQVPENAHVLGNNWYCDEGYRRQGNECVKLQVPENAHVLGNNWYCDEGYRRQGNECVKLQVPENAHVLGNNWYCDEGYKRQVDICVKMTQKEIEQLRSFAKKQQGAMSDGSVAYKTRINSDNGDILKLDNGAIVEVTSGYIGYLGYRKRAILFGSASTWRIWIEGKRVFKCELIRKPVHKASPAKQVHIFEVKGNGVILIMLDGSIYEVDSMDHITSFLWLGLSDGLLIDGTELINFDEGESVTVNRLR